MTQYYSFLVYFANNTSFEDGEKAGKYEKAD